MFWSPKLPKPHLFSRLLPCLLSLVSVNPVNVLVAFRAHVRLTCVFARIDNIAFDVASSTNFFYEAILDQYSIGLR
jgi:hypothetical protein